MPSVLKSAAGLSDTARWPGEFTMKARPFSLVCILAAAAMLAACDKPAPTTAAVAPAAVQARPASEGQTPSTPAVQVTPIPVEPPSANAQPADVPHAGSAGVTDEKAGDPDDTSTAAISIINVKQG